MNAIRHEVLPASGVAYAATLRLTGRVPTDVVVARSNLLRVFELVEEEEATAGAQGGEGQTKPPKARLCLLREHRVHGTVTGVERVRTLASHEDGRDRLLVSFRDAKIALLEWSDETFDLLTVSLHTYERAPQLLSLEAPLHRAQLRVDPLSRCATLTLPQDALALLPFHSSQPELDADAARLRDIPYAPSYVLSLPALDTRLRGVRDAAFLPGLARPTLALLCAAGVLILALDPPAVLAAHDPLPGAFALAAAPAAVGGALVLAPGGAAHVGVSARRVALPPVAGLDLGGARCSFVGDDAALLVLRDGDARILRLVMDGPTLVGLELGSSLGQTAVPAIVHLVGERRVLVGSTAGDSVLLDVVRVENEGADMVVEAEAAPKTDGMDLDDDADLYGDSRPAPIARAAAPKHTTIHLELASAIPGHGAIVSMAVAIAKNGDKLAPELVAATGSSFALFQRDLPVRVVRKLHALGGARGIWALPLASGPVLLSTDLTPTPGLSRIAGSAGPGELAIRSRAAGATVACGAFFGGGAVLQILTNGLRVLEPDGTERQLIKDGDRARIRAGGASEPYALVLREDGTLGLFVAADARKMRRKDMSALGDKAARYAAAAFYAGPMRTSEAEGAHWLFLVRASGVLEIWALPKLTLVFSSDIAGTLPPAFSDTLSPRAAFDPAEVVGTSGVVQLLVAPLGETVPEPHLFVLLHSGHLAVYSMHAVPPPTETPARNTLLVRFANRLTRACSVPRVIPDGPAARQAQSMLVPFATTSHAGVFLTGSRPSWVVCTDGGGVRAHSAAHGAVHAFAPCPLWGADEFVLYADEGPCLVEWTPGVDVGGALPGRRVRTERPYAHVAYEPVSGLIVAAGALQAPFAAYDEDGVIMWEPEGPNESWPQTDCSTLELMTSDTFAVMDGYEFATNEFVTAVELVSLETSSTEAGFKEFIAVATTIDRGEDLAVRGAVYIFDIAEVVPDTQSGQQRWYKLRLMCKDDAKGPVTALCGMNGYLVSSMGQKIYVRAFDRDERLVGVAFLDVGIYVSSLRAVKNLLVLGDAVRSVWLVAFQEEPFKLVVVAKDVRRHAVARADLFFDERSVTVVAGDEDGVMRIYAYDPQDPESKNGQELVYKTEFATHNEYRTSLTIARRTEETAAVAQGKLLCGHHDGSLSTLTPVDDAAFKRLQLLQGQLVGKVQHVAGLNPRAFRLVRNDYFSKPLAKGILDANLLDAFMTLPVPRQDEFTKQIGTDTETIVRDYLSLRGLW